ncbi:MAG: LysR family transcriptional regulator [Pseudomonadota bacterium]
MRRNLDMTALRSFVAVAQTGGVTRAASGLNLTQSAVSMQMKRLEESLGLALFDRSGRGVSLTAEGDQLLSYARRILALNDEVVGRMTAREYEGEITLGVPHDIVYPFIPQVLRRFAADYPRMRVNLLSSWTTNLRDTFARGACAMILTTEEAVEPGGETLVRRPLVWIGAPGGQVWRKRPLRLAFERHCVFRTAALRQLEQAATTWEMAVESDSGRTIEATVSADMAVTAVLEGSEPPQTEAVPHGGALPDLRTYCINLYVSDLAQGPAEQALADLIRHVYRGEKRLAA